jgi:phosphoadenosine phosphosulfate reductase
MDVGGVKMTKEEASIELIRRGEKLALSMNPEDYFVGFSRGKDSQVLLELVKRAGVKYKAYYSVTTNDPPENVYFIRKYYPEVIFLHPKENFFKLVERKGLPIMFKRFCCSELKEKGGIGSACLMGVRKEESAKRAKYNDVAIISRRKEHQDRNKKRTIEEIKEHEHKCIKGKDKLVIRPILDWTTEEIWQFIAENNLPKNPCYNKIGRVGCMFCPFSSKKQIEYYCKKYPRYKRNLIKALEIFMLKCEGDRFWSNAEEYFEWWKSKKNVKEYMASKKQYKLF